MIFFDSEFFRIEIFLNRVRFWRVFSQNDWKMAENSSFQPLSAWDVAFGFFSKKWLNCKEKNIKLVAADSGTVIFQQKTTRIKIKQQQSTGRKNAMKIRIWRQKFSKILLRISTKQDIINWNCDFQSVRCSGNFVVESRDWVHYSRSESLSDFDVIEWHGLC